MAARVISALVTADAAQAQASLDSLSARSDAFAAQQQAAMDEQVAGADAGAADIAAAMTSIQGDLLGTGTAAETAASATDAAMDSLTATMAQTGGSAADAAAAVDAAMADLKASLMTVGPAAEDASGFFGAAFADIDTSMEGTSVMADSTAGDVAAAMASMGASADLAAGSLSTAMASMDASGTLAASDIAADSADMSASLDETAGSADAADASFMGLSSGGVLILGAALAGVAAVSIDLGEKFQTATAALSSGANISVAAAKSIGNAFTNQAFSTTFSAQQTMEAYSGVAAQLGQVEGHALDAAQATGVMTAAQDLAEASGDSLSGATSDLATVMQAYGQKSTAAAGDSNVLFNAARLTGQGVDSVTSSVQKLVAGLGVAAPSLGDIGGLMVDLASHGETGRKAISAVTTAMNTLIKSSMGVQSATQDENTAMAGMGGPAKALADQLQSGAISAYTYGQDTETLGGQQGELAKSFGTAYSAVQSAQTKLSDMGITVDTASGKFVGMASIISQLHDKIQGETQAQALATIGQVVGTTAAQKLYTTIEAGPAAYDKDVTAVQKSNSAHTAAEKVAATFSGQLEILKSGVEDLAVKLGGVLVPAVTDVVGVLTGVSKFFVQNQTAALALGAAVGVAAVAFGTIATVLLAAKVATLAQAAATTIAGAATGVWSGITGVATGVMAAFDAVMDANPIALVVLAIVGLIAVGVLLITHWQTVVNMAKTVWTDVVSFFTSMWHDASTVVGSLISAVVGFFSGLGAKIKSAIGDPLTLLLDIGKAIIEGLAKGITGAIGDAVNAIKGVASGVVNVAKSILSVFSPSQVFADIGANIGAGLAQGIMASKGLVNSATASLMGSSIGTAQVALSGGTGLGSVGTLAAAGGAGGSGGPGGAGGSSQGGNITVNVSGNNPQDVVNALRVYQQTRGSIPVRTTG